MLWEGKPMWVNPSNHVILCKICIFSKQCFEINEILFSDLFVTSTSIKPFNALSFPDSQS